MEGATTLTPGLPQTQAVLMSHWPHFCWLSAPGPGLPDPSPWPARVCRVNEDTPALPAWGLAPAHG